MSHYSQRKLIVIDGQRGVGKSVVAEATARTLGWQHVDMGTYIRLVSWIALKEGLDLYDDLLEELAREIRGARIRLEGPTVLFEDHLVTDYLFDDEVNRVAEAASTLPRLTHELYDQVAEACKLGPTVAEGRRLGIDLYPRLPGRFYLHVRDSGVKAHLFFPAPGARVIEIRSQPIIWLVWDMIKWSIRQGALRRRELRPAAGNCPVPRVRTRRPGAGGQAPLALAGGG